MALDTLSTLEKIRLKVRKLTKSLSENELSTDDIDDYVNTFILYDFPESLRLFSLRKTLTFFTSPYQDVYKTNTTDEANPLYNFENKYISIHSPIYISGNLAAYTESRVDFYANYSIAEQIKLVTTGDGATVNYSGTLTNHPVIIGKVSFTSIDANYDPIVAYDDGLGSFSGDVVAGGTIDYVTGVYDFTFDVAPGDGEKINSNSIPYIAGKPTTILYFDNEFTLRPVPDMPYRVEVSVYQRPTELAAAGSNPELTQWWQFISLSAAKKVFQDRMDLDNAALIEPELKQQELMVLRRTIMQQSQQSVSTIYNNNLNLDNYNKNLT